MFLVALSCSCLFPIHWSQMLSRKWRWVGAAPTGDAPTTSESLQWRHNERDGVLNHRRLDCLDSRLFRRKSQKTSKLRVTGLCEGNSPVTGEFPSQRASNAEHVSIWWGHHGSTILLLTKVQLILEVLLYVLLFKAHIKSLNDVVIHRHMWQ